MSKSKSQIPPDDVWAERASRYGEEVPLRQTRVPSVLADVSEFEDIAAERAALREAETRIRAEHDALVQRNEEARARHREALDRATFHGEEWPDPLVLEEWRGPVQEKPLFDRRHGILEAMELALLKERADEWRERINSKCAPVRERQREAAQAQREADAAIAPYDTALGELERLAPGSAEESRPPAASVEDRVVRTDSSDLAAREIVAMYKESRNGPPRRYPNLRSNR